MLLVEDDDDLRHCIARALGTNVDVECARDEGEALAMLDTGEFDAVLTDYELEPGLGTSLLDEVRARMPAAKRFLMSGRDEPEARASERRWDDFFQKPFEPRAVLAALFTQRDRDRL
jgi:DNA-binding response OmpR family regulator